MSVKTDIFEQIGRVNPLDDDKIYNYTEKFKKFYLSACMYFLENSGSCLYGVSMKPSKTDAVISFKIGGIWPFGEETNTSIENILSSCESAAFIPKQGYIMLNLVYKNALVTILDDEI